MMTVVERTFREHDLPEQVRTYRRHTMTLGWEDRVLAHGRRRTDEGVEFGLALPRGTVLREGDCLILDEPHIVVCVAEQPQPVFVIEPGSAPEWGLYAYHIGNRHQPLMITDRAIVCPDDPGVERLLTQQRIPFSRAMMPFTPAATAMAHRH